MVLRRLLITRVANTVPGIAVVVVGGLYFSSEWPPLAGAAGLVGSVVVGAILACVRHQLGPDSCGALVGLQIVRDSSASVDAWHVPAGA